MPLKIDLYSTNKDEDDQEDIFKYSHFLCISCFPYLNVYVNCCVQDFLDFCFKENGQQLEDICPALCSMTLHQQTEVVPTRIIFFMQIRTTTYPPKLP